MVIHKPKEVLVIDDDELVLHSIEKQLQTVQIPYQLEQDPVKALAIIMEHDFDLVLCDIKMKPITGLEVLREVKEKRPDLPVIILTGYVDDQIMEEAKSLGCADFLIKPVRKSILLASIEEVLSEGN